MSQLKLIALGSSVTSQTNVSSCYREMERLEQERKMKELEELRRKVWTRSQNVHKPYKTDQKVYIANPDKELGRLALPFVKKFVPSKTNFCLGVEGSGSYFLSCKYTFFNCCMLLVLILVVLLHYMLLCHTVGLKSDAKCS